ncbi:MAG: deoxyribonuclease IV [Candidatus Dependentiae bacterium]
MKHKKHSLLLGAHMSIAGGFDLSIARGQSIDCTAIQIFTKSNRQWQAKPISTEQADLFKKALKNSSISFIAAHASYLINLGASNKEMQHKSIQALAIELQRCDQLGIPYLVLHPGSRLENSQETALKQIAQFIDDIYETTNAHCSILLENMAGQGSAVCSTFEQLAELKNLISHKRKIGFCFDTCHAFAAGYDLRSEKEYTDVWEKFDKHLGLEHLKMIHLNDSKKELGSKVDRHEDIGKGKMGIESFKLFMNDKRLFDIPKILETPRDTLEDYARNMHILKQLLDSKTKKSLELED